MTPFESLKKTIAALRDPETGCPWDIAQNHQSLAECLVDECCELLQTIDRLDFAHMQEELGDVLLQVLMHAQIADEQGYFDFEAVCKELDEKLIRRHPHVFDAESLQDKDAVLQQWEAIKAQEKKRGPQQVGIFKDLPAQLPALLFAKHIFKQLQKLSLAAATDLNIAQIERNAQDLDEALLGQQLFALAAAARLKGLDPESALRRYSQNLVDELEAAAAGKEGAS
jgi:XTP/dITP diphosphohydrolase/tetrapyrrole methylase family protein/MazG family protein